MWTVTIRAPEAVFGDSRIVLHHDATPDIMDERTAAQRLVAMPLPIRLRGEEHTPNSLMLRIDGDAVAAEAHLDAPRPLAVLRHIGTAPLLLLAAGRAYRLSLDAIRHLEHDYHITAPLGGGGGLPDDPWTTQLRLPQSWLAGCGFVWLVGRQEETGMYSPRWSGAGWPEDSLVSV